MRDVPVVERSPAPTWAATEAGGQERPADEPVRPPDPAPRRFLPRSSRSRAV
ncbi:hypothetical protein EV384_1288 [Micromonospora kangleipakensis]|uniref:Uncharacterized protein n=1 Tax=Micromonospora kangleipakensis TaxID=1077942 RepID=A0A4Q8B7R4_9ACTN|nr:hypothetical protein [Micromonospora kangleipakensis]RZU72899.1 hypothetical protein EV384_1288 [Micromonospora kangleipakensis]